MAPALAVIDECVLRFFDAADGVRAELATDADRDAIYRLRYRVVRARGWADPAAFPDGRERDADDDRAVHVVAWAGEQLAATTRIILPSPGKRLPTEATFDVTVEPCGRVANIDRVAVAPEFSDPRHGVLLATLGRAWQEVRALGYRHWVGVSTVGMIRLYRLAGMQMTVLGPPRRYWGEERIPVLFDPIASAPRLARRWLGQESVVYSPVTNSSYPPT
ncbi:MAG: acyl-homoserine-lactone synthase [Thermomicrobiales bacterium]